VESSCEQGTKLSGYIKYLENLEHARALRLLKRAQLHGVSLVLFLVSWGGVRLSPLGTSATIWPTVPAPDDR
jgi:hypothetical protein